MSEKNSKPLAGLDADNCVAIDLDCRSCGYNLRTLHRNAACPECGKAVKASLRRMFTAEDRRWLSLVRWGMFSAGVSLLSLATLFSAIQLSRFGFEWKFLVTEPGQNVGLVLLIALAVGCAIPGLLVFKPRPNWRAYRWWLSPKALLPLGVLCIAIGAGGMALSLEVIRGPASFISNLIMLIILIFFALGSLSLLVSIPWLQARYAAVIKHWPLRIIPFVLFLWPLAVMTAGFLNASFRAVPHDVQFELQQAGYYLWAALYAATFLWLFRATSRFLQAQANLPQHHQSST